MQFNGNICEAGSMEGAVLMDKYRVGRQLGQGSFGFVHKVKYIDSKDAEACKHIVLKASFELNQLYNEVQALMHMHQFAKGKPQYEQIIQSIPRRLDHGLTYVNKREY